MGNFITRTLFGAIFVIVLIAGIVIHPLAFYPIFLAITLLTNYEFYKLIQKNQSSPQIITGLVAAFLTFTSLFAYKYLNIYLFVYLLIPVLVSIPIIEMYRKKENPLGNIASTLMGLIYVTIPFALLNYLVFPFGDNQYHWEILMGVFLLIWANDTGAYLVGVNFGKHRLFERISPKKSWEGSIGGAIITLSIGYLISIFSSDLNLVSWLLISIIVVLFGSLGDLVESMLKRNVGIKDSGTLIPGHGGLLDRFDAILLVSPMVFMLLQIIKEYFH